MAAGMSAAGLSLVAARQHMSALGHKRTFRSAKCHKSTYAPRKSTNKCGRTAQGPATITKLATTALLGGEAIEQPVASSTAQIILAAAAVRPSRGMRRIPRPRRRVVAQPFAVNMTNHGRALGAACPVTTGAVLTRGKRATFWS